MAELSEFTGEFGKEPGTAKLATGKSATGKPGTGSRTGVLARPGARVVYEVTGHGPAVVLAHGFGLDMRMWDPQVAHLAERFRVVRYDCRGFGSSGPLDPAVPYTHAGDLIALLDHLTIADAVLAGLSFGGRVVLQAALAAPARVRGLALLDAVLDGVPWDRPSADALDEVARQVQAGGVLAGRAAWLAHPLFAAARERPAIASRLAAMVAGYPGQHWLGQDPHSDDRRPIDALADVTAPTLVLAGERDVPGFLEMSAVLARRIPGAEYHVVAGAGHMVNMEQPAAVNELLTRFLDGLAPAGTPAGRGAWAMKPVQVAAVQAAPVLLDRDATISKVVALAEQAAAERPAVIETSDPSPPAPTGRRIHESHGGPDENGIAAECTRA